MRASQYVLGSLSLLSTLVSSQSTQYPMGMSDHDGTFHVFQSPHSPSHSIRLQQQNSSLCDTGGADVSQYTGWLDVGHAHFFFWYFTAENKPAEGTDPLTLWMTGGPGGSSMLGMLQELGPCLINQKDNGSSTVYNPYGWNKDTALIFVDQPAGVGFSYVDEGYPIPGDSFMAAEDMHHFLQMFTSQVFPGHAKGPFTITGESYAGHYVPTLAAQIVSQNKLYPRRAQVPLAKVAIGNGFVSPKDTTFGYWPTLCTVQAGLEHPVFNETRCDLMAEAMPRCLYVLDACYNHPDAAICTAAIQICEAGVILYYDGESYKGGRNRFDITHECEMDDLCYLSSAMIQNYLNLPDVWEALDVPKAITNYSIMSGAVSDAFTLTNDLEISMEAQVRYILENQIDVLIYQGNWDLACNTAGNLRWADSFIWKGNVAFQSQALQPWNSTKDGEVVKAGNFKEVNIKMGDDDKKTRFAFVTVDRAGHMVPQDQPEIALDLLTRWLKGEKYA